MCRRARRRPIAQRFFPQKYSLFPDKTVLDNITSGRKFNAFNLLTRPDAALLPSPSSFSPEAMDMSRRLGLHDADGRKYPDRALRQQCSIGRHRPSPY